MSITCFWKGVNKILFLECNESQYRQQRMLRWRPLLGLSTFELSHCYSFQDRVRRNLRVLDILMSCKICEYMIRFQISYPFNGRELRYVQTIPATWYSNSNLRVCSLVKVVRCRRCWFSFRLRRGTESKIRLPNSNSLLPYTWTWYTGNIEQDSHECVVRFRVYYLCRISICHTNSCMGKLHMKTTCLAKGARNLHGLMGSLSVALVIFTYFMRVQRCLRINKDE